METPESLVYQRREGTGAAQVFGSEGNPLRPLAMLANNAMRQRALDDERKRQAKADRDKRMIELISQDPEKTFAPFNQQVADLAQAHRNKVTQYAENGGDLNSPNFIAWNKKGWEQVNDSARRGLYIQDKIKEVMAQIKENPYLAANQKFYAQKLLDIYMDPNGSQQGIPLDKVDVNKIENIIVDNPEGFDQLKYAQDFMKDVKENVFNYTKNRMTSYGIENTDMDIKIKGELYTPDPDTKSGVVEDANGDPIINATPYFLNSFLSNGTARRAIEKAAAEQGVPVKEYVEGLVRPQGGHALDKDVQTKMNPEWFFDAQRGYQFGISFRDVPYATDRWKKIRSIVNAYDANGNVTSDAKAALGEIKKNLKISGADVLDAQFVKGTNVPGNSEVMGMNVENRPYDRVVFKTIRGSSRVGRPMEFNLDDEGSMAELNGMFEQAKSEGGRHFSVDQLQGLAGERWNDIKRGREGRTEMKEEEKAAENTQVTKWQAGEDPEGLVGRVHNGKVIKNAKLQMDSGVAFGFGKKPAMWDVEYEDGSYGEIPLDYDTLASVFQGKSTAAFPTPEEFDKKWASLKSGESAVGPDGVTYTKK